ncbi:MAG: YhcH/YjgK/YiaL family protein [Victivallales bacterium]|nr:YhcH/YjgK/YiaL family protein [Victivallales bacterium]
MIFDSMTRLGTYFKNETVREKILSFIAALNADTEEKTYELMGSRLTAAVSSYQTRPAAAGIMEAHHHCIDMQVLISGEEEVFVGPVEKQTVKTPYNPERDAEFYAVDGTKEVKMTLNPSCFALLFPADAHMPCIAPDNHPGSVKKCVFKIHTDLF